jgi:hypothetical protein
MHCKEFSVYIKKKKRKKKDNQNQKRDIGSYTSVLVVIVQSRSLQHEKKNH